MYTYLNISIPLSMWLIFWIFILFILNIGGSEIEKGSLNVYISKVNHKKASKNSERNLRRQYRNKPYKKNDISNVETTTNNNILNETPIYSEICNKEKERVYENSVDTDNRQYGNHVLEEFKSSASFFENNISHISGIDITTVDEDAINQNKEKLFETDFLLMDDSSMDKLLNDLLKEDEFSFVEKQSDHFARWVEKRGGGEEEQSITPSLIIEDNESMDRPNIKEDYELLLIGSDINQEMNQKSNILHSNDCNLECDEIDKTNKNCESEESSLKNGFLKSITENSTNQEAKNSEGESNNKPLDYESACLVLLISYEDKKEIDPPPLECFHNEQPSCSSVFQDNQLSQYMSDSFFLWLAPSMNSVINLIKRTNVNSELGMKESADMLLELLQPVLVQSFCFNREERNTVDKSIRKALGIVRNIKRRINQLSFIDPIIQVMDDTVLSELYLLFVSVFSFRSLKSQKISFHKIIKSKKEIIYSLPSNGESLVMDWQVLNDTFTKLQMGKFNRRSFHKMQEYFKAVFFIFNEGNPEVNKIIPCPLECVIRDLVSVTQAVREDYYKFKFLRKLTFSSLSEQVEEEEKTGSMKKVHNTILSLKKKQDIIMERMRKILEEPKKMALFIICHISTLLVQRLLSSMNNKKEMQTCFENFKKFIETYESRFSSIMSSQDITQLRYSERMSLCTHTDTLSVVMLYILFGFIQNYLFLIEEKHSYVTRIIEENSHIKEERVPLDKIYMVGEVYEAKIDLLENLRDVLRFITSNRKVFTDHLRARTITDILRIKTREMTIFVDVLKNKGISEENENKLREAYTYIVNLYRHLFTLTEKLYS